MWHMCLAMRWNKDLVVKECSECSKRASQELVARVSDESAVTRVPRKSVPFKGVVPQVLLLSARDICIHFFCCIFFRAGFGTPMSLWTTPLQHSQNHTSFPYLSFFSIQNCHQGFLSVTSAGPTQRNSTYYCWSIILGIKLHSIVKSIGYYLKIIHTSIYVYVCIRYIICLFLLYYYWGLMYRDSQPGFFVHGSTVMALRRRFTPNSRRPLNRANMPTPWS